MARKTPANPTLNPPSCLGDTATSWWRKVQGEFNITDAPGAALLEQAARALDRAEKARAAIDRDGLTVTDRFGCVKHHPLLPHLRDAESSFRSSLRDLRLDVELPKAVGRPSGV